MSLVGTRPPTVDEFEQYEGYHKRRLSMTPGLTGVWQVSGRSDITDFEEIVSMDVEYIKNKGTLIVGITDFEPMDYKDGDEWIGFDADMARVVGEKLGVDVQFVEIDWDTKTMELESKNIDVPWNVRTHTATMRRLLLYRRTKENKGCFGQLHSHFWVVFGPPLKFLYLL